MILKGEFSWSIEAKKKKKNQLCGEIGPNAAIHSNWILTLVFNTCSGGGGGGEGVSLRACHWLISEANDFEACDLKIFSLEQSWGF